MAERTAGNGGLLSTNRSTKSSESSESSRPLASPVPGRQVPDSVWEYARTRSFSPVALPLSLQYTIEKMGKAESVTTFDTEDETLSQQLEAIRTSTEKIAAHVQYLIQPHPGE